MIKSNKYFICCLKIKRINLVFKGSRIKVNMGLNERKQKVKELSIVLEEIKNNADKNLYSILFVELMHSLRPSKSESSEMLMQQMLAVLQNDKQMESQLQ